MSVNNEGIIVILSSPSGAGKTTLVKEISKKNKFQISISHTTRKPRSNETDGKDYYFVTKSKFKKFNLKNSDYVYENILSLPYNNFMSKSDVVYVCKHIKKFISQNQK